MAAKYRNPTPARRRTTQQQQQTQRQHVVQEPPSVAARIVEFQERLNRLSNATPTDGALALAEQNGKPAPGTTGNPNRAQNNHDASFTPSFGYNQPNGKQIPDMERVSPDVPTLINYGATGTSFFSGLIQNDEYQPDFAWRDGILKYEMMRRNDPQIAAQEKLMTEPILAADWSIEPASNDPIDKEIASFVESCLFHDLCYQTTDGAYVRQSWQEILRHILLMFPFGFSMFETCFRIEDGWVKWSRWLPMLPRTIWRWWVGEDNELVGIQQWSYKDYTYRFVNIPTGKLLRFTHRQEGQNYEGVSVLRQAFKPWWFKQNFEKILAVAIERNGIEVPWIRLGATPSASDVSAAITILKNIRANEFMGIVTPNDWDFQYPKAAQNHSEAIMPAIQYCDTMIARNILGQFLDLGSTETGAYNLDASQKQTFLNSLQAEVAYICDTINQSAIRQLVDYNYSGVGVYPKLTCSKLVAQDITTLSSALAQLTAYVPPSPAVGDFLSDLLGLPKPPKDVVEATNPTNAPAGGEGKDGGTNQEPKNAAGAKTGALDDSADAGGTAGRSGGGDGTTSSSDGNGSQGQGNASLAEPADATDAPDVAELHETAQMLNEAVSAIYGVDAIERGMEFINVNHIPAGNGRISGQFAPRGGGGGGGEEPSRPSGGSARARGSGGSTSSRRAGGGGRTRASASSRPAGGQEGTGRTSAPARVTTPHTEAHAEENRQARLAQARSDLAEAHTRTVAAATKRDSIQRQQTAANAKYRDESNRLEATRRQLEEQAKEQIIAERATRAPRTYEKYTAAKQEFETLDPQREKMMRDLDMYGSHSPHSVQREIEQEVRNSIHYNSSTTSYRAYQRALQNSPRYGEWQHAQEQLDAYQKLNSETYNARGNMLRYEEQLLGNRLENSAHVIQHPDFLAQKAIFDDAESTLNSLNARLGEATNEHTAAHAAEERLGHRVALLERTTENGVTFSNDSARGAPERVFGRSLSSDEIKSLAGGRSEDYVTIEAHGNSREFSVKLESEDGTRTGDFGVTRRGNRIIVQVGTVRNTGASGAGVAHDITGSLGTMRGLGVNEIHALAARAEGGHEHGFNGYYTWARLGFVGSIPSAILPRAQAEFGPRITRVEQIMGFGARGRNWWKANGDSWQATFNFDANSYSMQTLKGWQQAVGRNG